jgi:hypothetical protein|tara:strand:- start:7862 stop:8707 length:846 start_codon:yes stop_codon:yes gene_type:complete
MTKEGVDDIFKDFEHKIKDKLEAEHADKKGTHKTHEKKLSEEERLKIKYQEAEESLKHKYKKEKEALEEKKKKEMPGHEEMPHRPIKNIERAAYVAVILILVAYTGIDLIFYHGNNNVEAEGQIITVAAVKQEDKGDEIEKDVEEKVNDEEETVEEVKEEKKLSGIIDMAIDNIYKEVSDKDSTLGYISKIVFTIENGKETTLNPIVDVYAYDSEMHESWEEKSRGKYIGAAIKSGEKLSGVIDLSPKSFRNLDIKKNIRLTLNDTKEGFITAVNEKVAIS